MYQKIFMLFLLSILPYFFPSHLQAATFPFEIVRLDRIKSSTSTTGLVCLKPSTNATENSFSLTFPSNFTVSSTLSHWTVSTSNLPATVQGQTVTAWPGIATATNVSGQTVTFPSSDLSTSNTYCFTWNNSQAVTTGATGNISGSMQTRTSSNSAIDSGNYFITIKNNDQVTLSATVPANSSDAEVTLNSSPVSSTLLREDDEVTFTISYRSLLSYNTNFTLEGLWEQGLINGTSSNYIDVFDYVIGSATTADDGTIPVVDLVNRKITWTFLSLAPSATPKTVSFKLKVRSNLPTTNVVTVPVKSRGYIASTVTPTSTLNFDVQKLVIPTSTPTITPSPTITLTPTLTLTPTTAPTAGVGPTATPALTSTPTITPPVIPQLTSSPQLPQTPQFISVAISELSDTYAQVDFRTTPETNYTVYYGTSTQNLDQKLLDTSFNRLHQFRLDALKQNTIYYFRINITNRFGQTKISDIFTFKTAATEDTVAISKENVIISSNDIILSSKEYNSIVSPPRQVFSIAVGLKNIVGVDTISARFESSSVLGINTIVEAAAIEEVDLVETSPGMFTGKLETPQQYDSYNLILYVRTNSGGLYTRRIPYNFYIVHPLAVYDKQNNKPIENAKISLSRFEESLKRFTPLNGKVMFAYNTDEHGELNIALPSGTYIVEVTAPKYESTKERFELGISRNSYPSLFLNRNYSFIDALTYNRDSFWHMEAFLRLTARNFFSSALSRSALVIIGLVFATYLTVLCIDTNQKSRIKSLSKHLIRNRIFNFSIDFIAFTYTFLTLCFIYKQSFGEVIALVALCIYIDTAWTLMLFKQNISK